MKAILRHPITTTLLGWLIWLYMALCNRTIRWTVEGEDEALEAWAHPSGIIVGAWHETILLLPSGWNRVIRKWPNQREPSAMLISLSRDGEPVAKAIKHLGLEAVRGSSANKKKRRDKGGSQALSTALKILKGNGGICITPDGPRGPARKAQNGPILMAQRSGAVIVPYAIVSSPTKRLNTWDGFRIPYPLTRGAVVFGEAVYPTPGADKETLRSALEQNLNAAMERAEAIVAKPNKKSRPEDG